jgi:hypothetical protein
MNRLLLVALAVLERLERLVRLERLELEQQHRVVLLERVLVGEQQRLVLVELGRVELGRRDVGAAPAKFAAGGPGGAVFQDDDAQFIIYAASARSATSCATL